MSLHFLHGPHAVLRDLPPVNGSNKVARSASRHAGRKVHGQKRDLEDAGNLTSQIHVLGHHGPCGLGLFVRSDAILRIEGPRESCCPLSQAGGNLDIISGDDPDGVIDGKGGAGGGQETIVDIHIPGHIEGASPDIEYGGFFLSQIQVPDDFEHAIEGEGAIPLRPGNAISISIRQRTEAGSGATEFPVAP